MSADSMHDPTGLGIQRLTVQRYTPDPKIQGLGSSSDAMVEDPRRGEKC